jgi:hypothetical protein
MWLASLLVCFISFLFYRFDPFGWFIGIKARVAQIYSLANIILNGMNGMQKPSSAAQPAAKFNAAQKSMCITYSEMGQVRMINIPTDLTKIRQMEPCRVILHMTGGHKVDITQRPGIPYLVNAAQLGGTHFEIYNQDTERSDILVIDAVPGYLDFLYQSQ